MHLMIDCRSNKTNSACPPDDNIHPELGKRRFITESQHLLAFGHTRIGIILTGGSDKNLNQSFAPRYQGYCHAMKQHRVEIEAELAYIAEYDKLAGETEEMGYEGCKHLLQLDHPPSAIFVTSDYKAAGAMRAARDLGVNIPNQLSLVGYDNVTIIAYTKPTLTTVHQNSDKLGEAAVKLLLFHWSDDARQSAMKEEIKPNLIVRESTAAVPAKRILHT